MNYTGVPCPVCGKPFADGDDIVVCPECGAPHHRECYKKLGHCALEQQLHAQGLSWQNPNDTPQNPNRREGVFCPNCGLFCDTGADFCPNCHFPLHKDSAPQQGAAHEQPVVDNPFEGEPISEIGFDDLFEAIYADDEISGIPAKDYIFIVRQNYIYFLRVFKILSQRAKAKVFNWCAFLFGFLYFFYRKMYKIGTILLGIYLVSNIPALVLSFHMIDQALDDPMLMSSLQFDLTGLEGWAVASQLMVYFRLGVAVFAGFVANRFYFSHCKKKIEQLRSISTGGSENEYFQTLSAIGGVSPIAVFLVAAVLVALVLISGTGMIFLLF